MADHAAAIVYEPSPAAGPIRQGEILSDVIEPRTEVLPADGTEPMAVDLVTHPFVVVVTQACDLERDFEARQKGNQAGQLRSILFCEAMPEDVFRGQVTPGSDIWKRIRQNKDERYMLLRPVAPEVDAVGAGFSGLGIDFRRHFTLPATLVYQQLQIGARRRTVLRDLYAAHLNSRLMFYLARLALPIDHDAPAESGVT